MANCRSLFQVMRTKQRFKKIQSERPSNALNVLTNYIKRFTPLPLPTHLRADDVDLLL